MTEAYQSQEKPPLEVFKKLLKEGQITAAIQLATRQDLHAVLGYEDALREGFLLHLKKGNENKAKRLKDSLGSEIDFKDQIIEGYLSRLGRGRMRDADLIKEELGEGVDFQSAESYRQAVQEGYLNCLRMGQLNRAEEIKTEKGEGIDFRSAEKYEAAVKSGLTGFLQSAKLDQARRMIVEYGEGLSVVAELRRAIIRCLHIRDLGRAEKIKNEVGRGIELNQDKFYRDGIKRNFLYYLRWGWIDDAERIKKELSEGADLRKILNMAIQTQLKMDRKDLADKIRQKFGLITSSEAHSDNQLPPRS